MADPCCIFCKIIDKTLPATILYEDEQIIIFTDIKPASKFHYLVVPKEHKPNAKQLVPADLELLKTIIQHGENILTNEGFTKEECMFGFHWPPFCSVSHLHMHAIAPTSDLNFLNRCIFKPNTYWFVTPDYVLSRLENSIEKSQL